MINVSEAKTSELVKFYNEKCEEFNKKPVKKFADRKTAEKRVQEIVDLLGDAAEEDEKAAKAEQGFCPKCGAASHSYEDLIQTTKDALAEAKAAKNEELIKSTQEDLDRTIEEARQHGFWCIECDHSFGKAALRKAPANPAETSAKLSASIAKSWQNPEVAAKRKIHHGVVVKDKTNKKMEFGSVRKAFVALGLPLSKHIKFRMALKAAGTINRKDENSFGYTWSLVSGKE